MLEWYVPYTNIQGMKQGGLTLASSPAQFNNTFPYKSNGMAQYYMIQQQH